MDRREAITAMAGIVGIAGVESVSEKRIGDGTICVIELGEDVDVEVMRNMLGDLTPLFKDVVFIALPHGTSIKCFPNGGVYHREKLGQYEIEIVAKTEEDLRERMPNGRTDAERMPNVQSSLCKAVEKAREKRGRLS